MRMCSHPYLPSPPPRRLPPPGSPEIYECLTVMTDCGPLGTGKLLQTDTDTLRVPVYYNPVTPTAFASRRIETERQTVRQTDRQAGRQTHGQTRGQTDTQTQTDRQRQTDKQTGSQTGRQTVKQKHKDTDMHIGISIYIYT